MFKSFVTVFLSICLPWVALSQDIIKPSAGFIQDSLKIGQPVAYYLSISYPENLDVVFPDSLFNYQPFELDHKEYFPTRTAEGISYDSAVYYLSSFEIDSVQYLSLPVFLVNAHDSATLATTRDSIFMKQMVTEIPDSVAVEAMPLRENTDYVNLPLQFNYPYFILGAVVVLIILVVILVFFGSRIMNKWRLYRMEKKHRRFLKQFDELHQDHNEPIKRQTEQVIHFWKDYLEKLETWPYTTLTTRELIATKQGKDIERALREMDRTVYSNQEGTISDESYDSLKSYADNRFKIQTSHLRHG